MSQGVNRACDWWAVGVVVFEMLTGVLPFTDPDGEELVTLKNVIKGKLHFPEPSGEPMSEEARAFIVSALCTKVPKRLGYLQDINMKEDVLQHAWFVRCPTPGLESPLALKARDDPAIAAARAFDFGALVNKTMKPPFVPKLRGAEDARWFPNEDELLDEIEEVEGDPQEISQWRHCWDAFVL